MRVYILIMMTISILLGCSRNIDESVMAEIDGKEITASQFDAFIKFKRIPTHDEMKLKEIKDRYIEREALASGIEKLEYLDNDLIQAELNEFKKEMLISRYFEKYLKNSVSDQAIKNYYKTHAADYEKKKAHVAHILIRTRKNMDETERKVKLTTAREAHSLATSGGDFAELVRKYSEDKISVKKGGDIGWIKEGAIDPDFSKKVFAMEKGEISEPLETPFGFHIVKLIEPPQVVRSAFEKVSGDIRYQLRVKAKQKELERILSITKIEKKY